MFPLSNFVRPCLSLGLGLIGLRIITRFTCQHELWHPSFQWYKSPPRASSSGLGLTKKRKKRLWLGQQKIRIDPTTLKAPYAKLRMRLQRPQSHWNRWLCRPQKRHWVSIFEHSSNLTNPSSTNFYTTWFTSSIFLTPYCNGHQGSIYRLTMLNHYKSGSLQSHQATAGGSSMVSCSAFGHCARPKFGATWQQWREAKHHVKHVH